MANLKISELDAASSLTGTELVPVVQGGDTVQTTAQDIADLAAAAALSALSDHEAAADPHPGYLTQAEGDALYEPTGGGGIGGSTGSTDNALLRADGTGGAAAQASGVLVSDNDEISGYRANINAQTGTTYTLDASDAGKIVTFANASAITVTLPNSLPDGWTCTWVQKGAGVVTFDPASGATLNNRQAHTDSAGQWAQGALYVDGNSGGSSAVYVLGGDTA